MSPGKVRERLLTRLLGALQAFERPVVLVFEDLHWAGSDSLNLLHELCRRAENLPLLILASAIEGDGPSVHDQLSLFDHMPLEPLSDEQIGELSRELLGEAGSGPQFLAFLSRETGGNAFVLTEVVRAIADDMGNLDSIGRQTLPADLLNGGVRRLVERRLEQIPTNYHRLLQAAAAYGRVLDLIFLRVLDPQIDLNAWLLACSEATLLDVQDEQWRFTHDRIRIGILDLLPPQERQAVHQEVAVALESYGKGADTYVMSLAYHWRLAGVAEAEESYVARAGSLSVYTGALASYREALQLHTPPAEALPLFVRCAEALAKLGNDARAVELLGHVLHHPEIPDALMDTAEELLFLLQERLLPDTMAKSWESGKALSFDAALSVAQKDIS